MSAALFLVLVTFLGFIILRSYAMAHTKFNAIAGPTTPLNSLLPQRLSAILPINDQTEPRHD